jgi:uncharacterized membrane protein
MLAWFVAWFFTCFVLFIFFDYRWKVRNAERRLDHIEKHLVIRRGDDPGKDKP